MENRSTEAHAKAMSVCRRGVYDFSMLHIVFVIIALFYLALIFT